jgi:hypothetical protein
MSNNEGLKEFSENISSEERDFSNFEKLENFTKQIKEERFLKEEYKESDMFGENFTNKLKTLNTDWGNEVYKEEKDTGKINALFLGVTIALSDIFEDSKQNNTEIDLNNISIDQIVNHPAIKENNFKNINLTLNNLKEILNISPQKEGTVQNIIIKRWEANKKALPIIFENIYSKAQQENNLGGSKIDTDYSNIIGGSLGGITTLLTAQKTNLPLSLLAGGSAYLIGKTANNYLTNKDKSLSNAIEKSTKETFKNFSSLFKKGKKYFQSSENSRTAKAGMTALGIGAAALTIWKGGDFLKSIGGVFSSNKKSENSNKNNDNKSSSALMWGTLGVTTAAGLLAAYNLIPKIPDVKGTVEKVKQKTKDNYDKAKIKISNTYNTFTTPTNTNPSSSQISSKSNQNTTSNEINENHEIDKENVFYNKIIDNLSLTLSNDAVNGSGIFDKTKENIASNIKLEWITDENSEFRQWVKNTLNITSKVGMYVLGVLFAVYIVKKLLKSKFTAKLGSMLAIKQIFTKGLQNSSLKLGVLSTLLGGILYGETARGSLFKNASPSEIAEIQQALTKAEKTLSPEVKIILGFTKDNIKIPKEEKETYKNNFINIKRYISSKNFKKQEQDLIKQETISTCELLSAYQDKSESFPKYLITSLYKNLDILGIKQKIVENNNLYLYRINTDPVIEFKNLLINPDYITHETNETFKDFEKEGLKAGYNRLQKISRHVENEYIEKHNGEKLKINSPKTEHQKEWKKWLNLLIEFENLQKEYPNTKIPKNFWKRKEWKILEKFSYSTKISNNNGIIQLKSGEAAWFSSTVNICIAPDTNRSEINPFLTHIYPNTTENIVLDPHRKGWRKGSETALENKIASLDKYPEAQVALKELKTKLSQTQNVSEQIIILKEAYSIINKYTNGGITEAFTLIAWPVLYGSFEALIKSPLMAQYDGMMTIIGQNGEEFSLTEYLTKTYLGPLPYGVAYALIRNIMKGGNGFFTDTNKFVRFANIINPIRIVAKGTTAGIGRVFGAPGMIEQIKFQYNSVKGLHFIPPEIRHLITSGNSYESLLIKAAHYEKYVSKFSNNQGKTNFIAKQFANYKESKNMLKRIYSTADNIYYKGENIFKGLMEIKAKEMAEAMKNIPYEKLDLKFKPFREIEKLKLEAIAKYNAGIFSKQRIIIELDNISKSAKAYREFHTFNLGSSGSFTPEEKIYNDFDNTLKNERNIINNNKFPKVNISDLKNLPKNTRQTIIRSGKWKGHKLKINHATEFAKNVFASGTKALGKTLEFAGKLVPYGASGLIGFDAYINWVKYYEDIENANLGLASVHKGMSIYRGIEAGVILSGTGAGQRALVKIPKIGRKLASGAGRLTSLSMAPLFIAGEILYANASSSLEKDKMKEKDYIKTFKLEDLEVGKNKLLHLLSLSLNENTVGDNITNWFKDKGIEKKSDKRKEMWKAYGFLESQKFDLTISERRLFTEEFFHFIKKINSSIPPYKFLQNIKIVKRASLWAKKRIETIRNKGLFGSEMKIDNSISFETMNENIDLSEKEVKLPDNFDILHRSISQLYITLGGKYPITKEGLRSFFRKENGEHFGLYWNKEKSEWYIYLRGTDQLINGKTPQKKYTNLLVYFDVFKSKIFHQNEDSKLVSWGSPYYKRLEERAIEFEKTLTIKNL